MKCYKNKTRFSASSKLFSQSLLLSELMSPELELTSSSLCVPVQWPGVGLGFYSVASEEGRRWGMGNALSGFT